MASRSVKLPDIGEGVAEAELVEWHVKVGDAVREDQVVAAVMTDKATVEIPSPADGTVTALGAEAGQVLPVGAELFRLEIGGGAGAAPEPGIAASEEVKTAESAAEGAGASDLKPAADGLEPKTAAMAAPEPPKPARSPSARLPEHQRRAQDPALRLLVRRAPQGRSRLLRPPYAAERWRPVSICDRSAAAGRPVVSPTTISTPFCAAPPPHRHRLDGPRTRRWRR